MSRKDILNNTLVTKDDYFKLAKYFKLSIHIYVEQLRVKVDLGTLSKFNFIRKARIVKFINIVRRKSSAYIENTFIVNGKEFKE